MAAGMIAWICCRKCSLARTLWRKAGDSQGFCKKEPNGWGIKSKYQDESSAVPNRNDRSNVDQNRRERTRSGVRTGFAWRKLLGNWPDAEPLVTRRNSDILAVHLLLKPRQDPFIHANGWFDLVVAFHRFTLSSRFRLPVRYR